MVILRLLIALSLCFGAAVGHAEWTCLGKVESSLEVKGELNDEAATVHEGV